MYRKDTSIWLKNNHNGDDRRREIERKEEVEEVWRWTREKVVRLFYYCFKDKRKQCFNFFLRNVLLRSGNFTVKLLLRWDPFILAVWRLSHSAPFNAYPISCRRRKKKERPKKRNCTHKNWGRVRLTARIYWTKGSCRERRGERLERFLSSPLPPSLPPPFPLFLSFCMHLLLLDCAIEL